MAMVRLTGVDLFMEGKCEFLDNMLKYNPKYDVKNLERAYDIAEKMHSGQMRKSGEPYLIHPIAVVHILAELGMDEDTLIAGLLHDVVEDTEYTKEELIAEFGKEVALLVDGVTKIGSLTFENKEARQAETLRKMFLAMSKDIRVLIIKLADRLHNLRTINYMTPSKIKEKCRETLDIYAPLASRLGIFSMKFELENICLKYLWPEEYDDLVKKVEIKKAEMEDDLKGIIDEIKGKMEEAQIESEVYGRTKHLYSIFRKMKYQNKQIDEIFDLMAVRVIVDSVKDCYSVLGIVHSIWTPVPGRFKDFIAAPKSNMYQSIHTTVIGDNGAPFEIQIRTKEMHQIAEYGIAAHWKYKEGISQDDEEKKLAWLRQSLEWQKDMDNPKEFLEELKMDLFENQVFVLTPKGTVMELPAGATPLDFAFKVHSEVGAKCVGAKVNGKMVTIDHPLENGNIVEIITSANSSGPSIDWLKIVKSPTARTKIRQWLKKENKDEGIDKGKVLLDKYIRKKSLDPKEVMKNSNIAKLTKELGLRDSDELYMQLSGGGNIVANVFGKLLEIHKEELEKHSKRDEKLEENVIAEINEKKVPKNRSNRSNKSNGITVKGVEGLAIKISRCCNPVPGDEIIGYITKGRGITVHRKDCPNMISMPDDEKQRFIEVQWEHSENETYEIGITILSEDRKGLILDVSKLFENKDTNITGLNVKTDHEGNARLDLKLELTNVEHMSKIINSIKSIQGVYKVYRS